MRMTILLDTANILMLHQINSSEQSVPPLSEITESAFFFQKILIESLDLVQSLVARQKWSLISIINAILKNSPT